MKDVLYHGNLAKWYDRIFYDEERTKKEVTFYDQILKKYGCKNILEIAAGSGRVTIPLAKKGYRMTGMDISSSMINIARQKTKSAGLDIDYYIQDMEKTNIKNKSYDCVLVIACAMQFMASNASVINALKSFNKHLKRGGILIFDTFNFWNAIVEGKLRKHIEQRGNKREGLKIEHNYTISHLYSHTDNHQRITRYLNSKALPVIERTVKYRIYTLDQIELLFSLSGFKMIAGYGDYNIKTRAKENQCRRLVIIAEKIR